MPGNIISPEHVDLCRANAARAERAANDAPSSELKKLYRDAAAGWTQIADMIESLLADERINKV